MAPWMTRLLSMIDSRLEALPLLVEGFRPVLSQAWLHLGHAFRALHTPANRVHT